MQDDVYTMIQFEEQDGLTVPLLDTSDHEQSPQDQKATQGS